jgi:hypothetical protein
MDVSYRPPSIGPLVHLRLPAVRSRLLTVCLYPAELPIEHQPRKIATCLEASLEQRQRLLSLFSGA